MKRITLILLLISAACGGERSVASKSADAYRDAQEKGIAVGGGDGHHHGAAPSATAPPTAATDHAEHEGQASAQHDTMEHGEGQHAAAGGHAAGHATASPTHAAGGHAAGHTTAQHSTGGEAAGHTEHTTPSAEHLQHATPTAQHAEHAAPASQHAQHAAGPPPAPRLPPPGTQMQMRRIDPAATLKPDPFDAPAPASVAEAARASQSGNAHKGH